jgi:threonine/homoserine/homoserine lactone efflux protein
MKILNPKASLWVPTAYATVLSAVSVLGSQYGIGQSIPGSMIALVCFLPLLTMMIAQTTRRNLSELEARIAELERQTAQKRI